MSSTVPIERPREILNITHMTPAELKRELAIYLFKLSFGKARNGRHERMGFPVHAGKQK